MRVRYTSRAFADLDDIRTYISQHNPTATLKVVATIEKIVARFGGFPESGEESDELDVRIVFTTRYPYRVYYRIWPDEISIVHIRHTSRKPLTKGDV